MSTIISSHKSALTIDQRQNAPKMLDDGKSERAVAEFFNVGKGTINRIKSNRVAIQLHVDKIGEIPENISKRKHALVVPMYEDIETAVIEFLKLARDLGTPVTGPMLRTLAERECSANRVERFKASEGWLLKVKARHGICGRTLSGDAAGVEKVVLKNWEEDLPSIIGSTFRGRYYPVSQIAIS